MSKKALLAMVLLIFCFISFNEVRTKYSSEEKVKAMISSGTKFSRAGELDKRDDLVKQSFKLLRAVEDVEGTFRFSRWYLGLYELKDKVYALEVGRNYYNLAREEGSDIEKFYSCYYLAMLFDEVHEADSAKKISKYAFSYSDRINNPAIKVLALILKATDEIDEIEEKTETVFATLEEALYQAKKIGDLSLQIEVLDKYSRLHDRIRDFSQAKVYRFAQLDLVNKRDGTDSVVYMGESIKLAISAFSNGDVEYSNDLLNNTIIPYFARNNRMWLKEIAFQVLRSNYLDHDYFPGLVAAYKKNFPEEYDSHARQKSLLWYTLTAYEWEDKLNIDSAKRYHEYVRDSCLKIVPKNYTEKVWRANQFRRIAQFYKRHWIPNNAIINYETAFNASSYLDYKIECAKMLDSIYKVIGDTVKAYRYLFFCDELKSVLTTGESWKIDKFKAQRDAAAKAQEDKAAKDREQNEILWSQIYSVIAFFVCILFAVLLSFTRITVPPKYVKIIGFTAFVFLFEFLILFLDGVIKQISGGNILISVILKFGMAAILFLLHHILESKTIDYILKRNTKQKK